MATFLYYEIWRSLKIDSDFTKIGTTSKRSFLDNDVVSGKTYYYYLIAVDALGNRSAKSSTKSIKYALSSALLLSGTLPYVREDFSNSLVEPILNPTGCWSDFNATFKRHRALQRLSEQSDIIRKDEIPDSPVSEDYPDNEC